MPITSNRAYLTVLEPVNDASCNYLSVYLDDPSSVELQRSLSWVFCKFFLVVDWVKKDSCSLLLRIYQGAWSLIHDPWSWAPGSNATRTQGIEPWSRHQGTMIQRGSMAHNSWSMAHGTGRHDPWLMVRCPGSKGHSPRPPHPLYMWCVCWWLKTKFLKVITVYFFYFFD